MGELVGGGDVWLVGGCESELAGGWCRSKREVLRRLGKNERDNKLVDRMIGRGDIIIEDGLYIIKDEYIKYLQRKVREVERVNHPAEGELEAFLRNEIDELKHELAKEQKENVERSQKCGYQESVLVQLGCKEEEDGKWILSDTSKVQNTIPAGRQNTISSGDNGEKSNLEYQVAENERLEGEKAELIEGIKKAWRHFCRGGKWSDYIEKIGLKELLGHIEVE